MPESNNKTALILGGSRGIGHAIAVKMAQEGSDVAFTYAHCEEAALETKAKIEALGRRCFCCQASLQELGAPQQAVAQAIAELGRVDALFSVAGRTEWYRITELTAEQADVIYTLNYRAPLLATQAVSAHMIAQGIKGSILYITSTHGLRAYPHDQIYGGLKAGLIRSTESIALELSQYGIRVNSVAPGMINVRGGDSEVRLTREWAHKVPLGRYGKAEEVANVAAFLASDQASYVTGITIKVDGGLILPGMPEDASPDAGYGWAARA
ncbi:MAG: SDR family oxidoreductase [Oscillospiraceae bacterium]|jgi:NAD(P)-dependent dehydrogenase (short-subunit alcohol dehydrogenase family)|nr:SDR family oxidoreductase [Oscillospiraceae bacterium]